MSQLLTPSLAPRSILFVPADRLDLAGKAARSEADAVCLDLEDAVIPSGKDKARQTLGDAAAALANSGKACFVRINSEIELTGLDLAVLPPNCKAVVLPKASGLHHIALMGDALDRIAGGGGPDAALIALVEDAAGLAEIISPGSAARPHDRLNAFFLGTEDLAATIGCSPDGALVQTAFHNLAVRARAFGVELLGYPGSIAEYRDLDKVRGWAGAARACGASGAFAIHPAQVKILNEVFAPDPHEIDWAKAILAAFEKAQSQGSGVASHDGRMIDRPIVLRAERILSRAPASA